MSANKKIINDNEGFISFSLWRWQMKKAGLIRSRKEQMRSFWRKQNTSL